MVMSGQVVAIVAGTPDATAAANWWRSKGADVILIAPDDRLPDRLEVLVVDEWTAETAPHVVAARASGARVTVLAELLLTATPRPVVAITGTAGKTTTTRLLAAMMHADGRAPLITRDGRAANAWPDHSIMRASAEPGDWFVAELTSTHLCYMDEWTGPDVAALTSLWADHVELHGSLDRYFAAKRRLFRRPDSVAVVGADDPAARRQLGSVAASRVVEFSLASPVDEGVWVRDGRLLARWEGAVLDLGPALGDTGWMHPATVACAAALALCCGVGPQAIMSAIGTMEQLPHRFNRLPIAGDVVVIDDSIAATPTKASGAIARCDVARLVLIAGGIGQSTGGAVHDSPHERDALAKALQAAARSRQVILFGSAAARLAVALPDAQVVDTLADATHASARAARPGDTVLFSPMFPVDQNERADFERLMREALTRWGKDRDLASRR